MEEMGFESKLLRLKSKQVEFLFVCFFVVVAARVTDWQPLTTNKSATFYDLTHKVLMATESWGLFMFQSDTLYKDTITRSWFALEKQQPHVASGQFSAAMEQKAWLANYIEHTEKWTANRSSSSYLTIDVPPLIVLNQKDSKVQTQRCKLVLELKASVNLHEVK